MRSTPFALTLYSEFYELPCGCQKDRASDFIVSHYAQNPLLDDRMLGIVVRDLSGQPIFNTCFVDGRTLPISYALGNITDTSNSGKFYISDLMVDPISGASVLTIDLLIWRENKPASKVCSATSACLNGRTCRSWAWSRG